MGLLIVGGDLALGGVDAPSKRFLEKVKKSNKLVFIFRQLRLRRVP